MADGLRSKTAMEKNISEGFDGFSKILQMQEQLKQSLLESRQARQIQQDLSVRLAALELQINSVPVSHTTNPLFVPHPHEQSFPYDCTPFKMEVPDFDGTEPLGWIFKMSQFLFIYFHNMVEDQIASFHLDGFSELVPVDVFQ